MTRRIGRAPRRTRAAAPLASPLASPLVCAARTPRGTGKLRIIGGEWRGRKLPIARVPGLRPTADRIRETLFNWLAADVPGARCLDLFAGAGALGLEALSRGAARCDFVEVSSLAAAQLRRALNTLGATGRSRVFDRGFAAFLDRGYAAESYDIVFLDPPFKRGLLDPAIEGLANADALAPRALIYAEYEASLKPCWPEGWSPWRGKRTPSLAYELYRVGGARV